MILLFSPPRLSFPTGPPIARIYYLRHCFHFIQDNINDLSSLYPHLDEIHIINQYKFIFSEKEITSLSNKIKKEIIFNDNCIRLIKTIKVIQANKAHLDKYIPNVISNDLLFYDDRMSLPLAFILNKSKKKIGLFKRGKFIEMEDPDLYINIYMGIAEIKRKVEQQIKKNQTEETDPSEKLERDSLYFLEETWDNSKSKEMNYDIFEIFHLPLRDDFMQRNQLQIFIRTEEDYLSDLLVLELQKRFNSFTYIDCALEKYIPTTIEIKNIYLKNFHSIDYVEQKKIWNSVKDYNIVMTGLNTPLYRPIYLALQEFVVPSISEMNLELSKIFCAFARQLYRYTYTEMTDIVASENLLEGLLQDIPNLRDFKEALPVVTNIYTGTFLTSLPLFSIFDCDYWYQFRLNLKELKSGKSLKQQPVRTISFIREDKNWKINGFRSQIVESLRGNVPIKYLAVLLKNYELFAEPITAENLWRIISKYNPRRKVKESQMALPNYYDTCHRALNRNSNSELLKFYQNEIYFWDGKFILKDAQNFKIEVKDPDLKHSFFKSE
jgi:hypothetical protein